MSALLRPYVPEDFDSFWQGLLEEALAAPLDGVRWPQSDKRSETHEIETVEFRSVDGDALHGWIASPGQDPLPAFVWLAPYGRWSMMPNEYGTREGMTSLSFNFFGEPAFHEEVYTPARGYFSHGADDPETWIFRKLFQNAVIAVRFLEAQTDVDHDRLGASGMSQGGGLAIWLGAHLTKIKAVAADMPFLGAIPWTFENSRTYRYPIKELTDFMHDRPLGEEEVKFTLSYYDTMNQATRCEVPTLVSSGLRDPAVRTEQVEAIYSALAGPKEKRVMDWGHDWHPSMIDANRDWLLNHL